MMNQEDKTEQNAIYGRIYEQPDYGALDIHNSSRWRFTIDRSNDQENEPEPSFLKHLISLIKRNFY